MEAAIQKFAGRAGSFRVEWKPFFLNEKLTDEGVPMLTYLEQKYGPQAAAAAKTKSGHLHQTAANIGIEFNSDRMVSNSLLSHCLLDYAATVSTDKQNQLAEALFHGYFTDGNKISSVEFLLKMAGQVGLDCDAARRHMKDEKVKERVHREYVEVVREHGVNGVPFFLIHSDANAQKVYNFSGAQPTETFCSIFDRLLGSSSGL